MYVKLLVWYWDTAVQCGQRVRLWGEGFSERGPTQKMDGGRKVVPPLAAPQALGSRCKKEVTPGRKGGRIVETVLGWCMCFGTSRPWFRS